MDTRCFSNIGHSSGDRPVESVRVQNAMKAKLSKPAWAMYMAGKVKLCRAEVAAKAANGGKGWR